jgi:hypothetical protein
VAHRRTVEWRSRSWRGAAKLEAQVVVPGELLIMLVALFAVVLLVALVAGWGTRRHLASQAWDRELEAAFAVGERREMPTRRVL